MQDLSLTQVENSVYSREELPEISLTDEDIARVRRCPASMYMLSLRKHARLPDELHEAMLLFSFDPDHADCVRSYLEWAKSCDDRADALKRFRRLERLNERLTAGLMLVCMFWLAAIILMGKF